MLRTIAVIAALLSSIATAWGQGTVLQGGPWAAGRAPMYVGAGSGQAVVQDSGPAGGGAVGLGFSEMLMVARGTGTPPYVGQGTGPLGTTWCSYDAPTTNATGYHYLCFGANPGQMVYGAGGAAAAQSFCFTVNGTPMCLGGTTGTGIATATLPTTPGAVSCWVNATGTLTDCSAGAATLFGRPTTSGIPAPFTIQGLTARGAPDANNDKIPVYDNASGTIKYVTPGLIAASATAGVSSIGGVVGALTLGPSLSMSGSQITFTPGGTNGQIQYNNAGVLGGFTTTGDVVITPSTGAATIQTNAVTTSKILDSNVTTNKIADTNVTTIKIANNNVTNGKLATGAANTVKGSVNGTTTSDIAVASCSALYSVSQWITGTGWSCGINPVLPSRAVAATLNLSAFSSVKTLGYATAGDGGGATFLNRTTTPFRDSFVTSVTISNNGTSGCTNGTYRNKQPTGGTGTNLILNMVVTGNVVSSVSIEETGGNGYSVSDVLTTTVTGCSTSVTVTVATISTPSCSFSDSASNHFQIVRDEGNFLNTRQCGAKVDYAGVDASATNDFTSIQNAMAYCADIHSPTIDGGGSAGCRLILPAGNSMICGGVPLNQPQGVTVEGHGMWASTIKICATWGTSANFWNICDPDTQASCFAAYLRNFTLYAPFNLDSNAGVSAIYSNNVQQVDVIDRVAVYAGRRRCLTLETGYGGAALLGIQNFECTPGDTSTVNTGIIINYGTTLVTMRNVHVETSGPNTMVGISITGGFVELVGFHTEGISTGIQSNISGSSTNGIVRLSALSGGASCTNLVNRAGIANVTVVGNAVPNGCTNTVNNSGVLTTTPVVANTLY